MPYSKRRTYRKKRTYKRKAKKWYNKRRRTYRRKTGDKGTYLKVSSAALPVVINNKAAAVSPLTLSPDTYQCAIKFKMGSSGDAETVLINNEYDPENSFTGDIQLTENDVFIGTSDLLSKYSSLYKYMQVYKIVVKFTPTITEGGVISNSPGIYFTNAISGSVTTDFDSGDSQSPYTNNYPPTLEGNAKANSRRVSREHNIYRGWSRTFVPKFNIEAQSNPKAKYQYKPEIDLDQDFTDINLSTSKLIIRMRKPQLAGFTAANIEGTETEFPDIGTFVRFGTLNVHAYIKFRTPLF